MRSAILFLATVMPLSAAQPVTTGVPMDWSIPDVVTKLDWSLPTPKAQPAKLDWSTPSTAPKPAPAKLDWSVQSVPRALEPLTYAEVWARVQSGESVTLAVGVSAEADGRVDALVGVEPGVYRCFRGADGRPKFEPIRKPVMVPAFRTSFAVPYCPPGQT